MQVSRVLIAFSTPVILVECFIISNLGFLALDIYVAHSMNGFAHWAEWLPFAFSLTAPVFLVVAATLSGSLRPELPQSNAAPSTRARIGRFIGLAIGACSILVGIAGLLWHLESQFFAEQTLKNLVYAAPFAAPLAYSGLGFLLLLDRMVTSETSEWARWVILLALGGWVGNFVLSLADHAQNAFFYWPESIPVVASALAIGALTMAMIDFANRSFLRGCLILMAVEIGVGIAGWILHLVAVSHSPMQSLWDRVVYSAPIFAPMLFADLAILAMIGLAALIMTAANSKVQHSSVAKSQ
jgi:hypothetical protein